ncbi:uncharacterized protein LOC125195131 [Salvia hispanica]|uniref:uncharacterized protein LOC125195131 n=1 Tax=Salvia hispanica TaxID=49212 RepID=UPI002009C772|nr:uncharacterized protein LOC125195131 [Salvia hispanica]
MEREREVVEQAAAAEQIPRPIRRRTFVCREHDVAHQRLFTDYFAEQPRWGPTVFHRRFRMRRDLFVSIVQTLEARDEYFQYREEGICRPGLTPLQKCTVVLRQLAYDTTADMFDEYLHVGPTAEDCQALMKMHETAHDFPGMLGSIDSESNNDINVLNSSNLFADQCRGRGPAIEFTANGRQYRMGYYLADGIYPRWPVFLKSISCPMGDRRVLFAAKQEAARKDVERAFGVLQSRWAIVKGPTRFWFKEVIADVMYACIILHNKIVEH